MKDRATGRHVTQAATDEAAHSHLASGDVNYSGHPATWYVNSSAIGAAAGVLATLNSASFNCLTVEVASLTATSADIYGSVDGTNFVGPLRLIDKKTNAVFATSAITAAGLYELKGKFKSIRIDQVGAGAVTVRYALSVHHG